MKTFFILIFTVLLTMGCNEATLEEIGENSTSFVVVNIDPPAAAPGSEIDISLALDNGNGTLETADIQIGNHMFVQKNMVTLKIPSDISQLLGDEVAKELRGNSYVDVPVKVTSGTNVAEKYFRIIGSSYKSSLYDENPSINTVSYKTAQVEKAVINPGEAIMFDPDDVPDKIDFNVDEATINENIKNNFVYSWVVFGTGTETPQIVESDKSDGSVTFSLKDNGGAPLIGTYRFYLILKPEKTYALSYEARYCNDFITFTVNTTGDADTTEEPDNSETEDNEVSDV